eukprot:CAMPEP_0182859010 /NCGR_PEP_ID=MMETSP0034_2-20130328/4024_1 /TAXON_ID=156128 /ORGANISM="Nephroselmis pyriformis, Strain CCMP717" /LENGTH=42 /DNA_ID= /DNA_START= /DNA_END= /DNA_ORIENTATION=
MRVACSSSEARAGPSQWSGRGGSGAALVGLKASHHLVLRDEL